MAITSVRCAVLGAMVTRITDREGRPPSVICAEYEEPSGICRLKRAARERGPLAPFLDRAVEETPDAGSIACDVRV
jgi:hypothetical protein